MNNFFIHIFIIVKIILYFNLYYTYHGFWSMILWYCTVPSLIQECYFTVFCCLHVLAKLVIEEASSQLDCQPESRPVSQSGAWNPSQ